MIAIFDVTALGYRGHGFDYHGVYITKTSFTHSMRGLPNIPKLITLKAVRKKQQCRKHTKIKLSTSVILFYQRSTLKRRKCKCYLELLPSITRPNCSIKYLHSCLTYGSGVSIGNIANILITSLYKLPNLSRALYFPINCSFSINIFLYCCFCFYAILLEPREKNNLFNNVWDKVFFVL